MYIIFLGFLLKHTKKTTMRNFSIIIMLMMFSGIAMSQMLDSSSVQTELNQVVKLQESFKPKEALSLLKTLLPRVKSTHSSDSKTLGKVYFHTASCMLDLAEYKEAKVYLDQALEIFKLNDSISLELGDTYMLIGIYYDYMTNYNKALAYYDLTKSIYLKLFPKNDFRFGYLYNNIGICIYFKGDVERALSFFNKSLAITVENKGDRNTKISRDITNLSQCHSKLKEPELALEKLSYSLSIAKQNKILDTFIGARIYHSLALSYFELKEYEEATKNINEAFILRKKHLPEQHDEIASTYFVMADIQLALKDTIKAISYLSKAEDIYAAIFGENHIEVAIIQTNFASIYLSQNKLNKALSYINKALLTFQYDENISPTEKDNFNIKVLKALNTKAKILYKLWAINHNIHQLKMANRIYTDLIYILNNFRKGFKEDSSKEILAADYFHIFDEAIEVSFALYETTNNQYYIKDAFERSEYSSSFILLEERRNNKAKSIAEIPDSLLKKEQQLKLDITFLEKKIREEEQKEIGIDQNKIINFSSQIFDLKEKYYTQIQFLESNFPRYAYHKNNLNIVSLEKLQSAILEHDQTLVEYFIGENYIFVFLINQDSFNAKKIVKNFPLESWIEELRVNITKFQFPFNLNKKYHEAVVEHSEGLYWEIISPVEKYFKEKIIIVPGGILAEIPFGLFIKKTGPTNTDYSKHHYLLKDYAISYCYSATLLEEMVNNRKSKPYHNAIAFAPSFKNSSQSGNLRDLLLVPLKFNTPEVEDISKILGAKKIIGDEATEDYFTSEAHKYSILHFATHAVADKSNSDYSFLAFSEIIDTIENELLFVKDIYNMSLESEMVTLSACQTGVGEHREGEGIISLARGFSFSGTSNINTSLWNVNDLKTAQLMKYFYKNIDEGLSKDEAMRKAKLKLISSYSNNLQVHPFFWSAIIPIGDMRPMHIPSQTNFLLWVFVFIAVISVGWWINGKKNLKFKNTYKN